MSNRPVPAIASQIAEFRLNPTTNSSFATEFCKGSAPLRSISARCRLMLFVVATRSDRRQIVIPTEASAVEEPRRTPILHTTRWDQPALPRDPAAHYPTKIPCIQRLTL